MITGFVVAVITARNRGGQAAADHLAGGNSTTGRPTPTRASRNTADALLKAMDRNDAELLVIGIHHRKQSSPKEPEAAAEQT